MLKKLSVQVVTCGLFMPTTQTSRMFSCRVAVPTRIGLWKWFGARSTKMVASGDGLDIQNQHIEWTSVQGLSRQRGVLSVSIPNGQSEFAVLSPLTGMQDPALASLIERLSIALSNNDQEQAEEVFKELRTFSMLAAFSKLASVFLVLIGGTLAFFFPAFLLASMLTAGGLSLGVVWLPTLYVNWFKQRSRCKTS